MLEHEQRELLASYLEIGAEPWNHSTEAAWYDFELRAWVEPRIPTARPLRACNVGIGVGRWDDWLGHVLGAGARLVSVDRDPRACRQLELRQRHERHPHPAEIVCGDVLDGALAGRVFELVTVVGSTLRENGAARGSLEQVLAASLALGGVLLVAEALHADDPVPAGAEVRSFGGCQLALRQLAATP